MWWVTWQLRPGLGRDLEWRHIQLYLKFISVAEFLHIMYIQCIPVCEWFGIREIDPQFESTGFQSPKPSLNLEVKLFEMMWSFVQLVAVRQTKNTKHLYTISNSDMFSRKLPYVLVECGFPVCFPRTSAKPEASSSTSSCTQTDTAWSTVTAWRLEGTISLHILSIPQV